jgi:hypothetical protein
MAIKPKEGFMWRSWWSTMLVVATAMAANPVFAGTRNNCQCTEYTKCSTGMIISGSGAQWDDNAASLGYKVVSGPVVAGAMNFEPSAYGADKTNGHVGKVVSYRSDGNNWIVTLRHANWAGGASLTDCGCSNVYEKEFTVPKTAKNVHYIAPPDYNKFVNKKSNKCVDVKGGSTDNWAHLINYSCSNDPNMFWKLVGVSVGSDYTQNPYFQIKNKKSQKCMDTEGGNTADWTRIIQYSCSTDSNMQWQPENGKPARFKNKKDLNKCLDLDHGNTDNWTDLILAKCNNDSNEKWNVNPQ